MSSPANMKPENVVNAYLFYSQRLLNLISSPLLTKYKADKMAITASACLSLKQAWQAWLDELSAYVGHAIPDYASIFKPEISAHPELSVLLDISQQPDSWLSGLIDSFEPRLNSPSFSTHTNDEIEWVEDASAKKINLLSVDSDSELSEEERLMYIVSSFKSYIEAVRGRQAEW